ncbi:MAG: AAA family ATPase, partial [Lachnospiraceae bacterium]|nr:AAA family ATPase [Lachnospiraceae bacterium]
YLIPVIRQRPILLLGAPGIGKTQIMEQIARECRIGLVAYTITHHTRQSAVGLPFIQEETFGGKTCSVTEYTMSEIIASVYRKIEEEKLREGILFIDEINCVSETLAPTMLQFLQCKTFGNQAVPQGWIIVAAGNPPEYNKSVRDFDMVTLDRVRRIEVEPDYGVWKEYARAQHVNNALLSYLELRPQNFYRVQSDVDGMMFVTARGWEDLSNLLDVYTRLGFSVDEEVIREFLQHEEIAKDVSAYLDLYRKYQDDYGIPEILDGAASPEIYQRLQRASFDERLSVVNLLLSGLNRYFMAVAEIKMVTDLWYVFLKNYRQKMMDAIEQPNASEIIDEIGNGKSDEIYQELIQAMEREYERDRQNGFLTRKEQKCREMLLEKLRQWKPLRTEDAEKAFLAAREGFDQMQDQLMAKEDETMGKLEHAFSFMESAFGEGQEMVVFVTELTMGTESSAYLRDNPSEGYQNYNQKLLVGTRRAEILSRLEEDVIRGEEHIRDF